MGNAVQISTSVSIISSLLGYQAISLSNMSTSAATVITAGSKVEIKSAFFNFTSDLTPNATSWTVITTGMTAYIHLTPSGTAGSQIVSGSWSSTAPVWSDSAQGWYASAASSIRVIGGCYKGGSASYRSKFILVSAQRELNPTDDDGSTLDLSKVTTLKLGTQVNTNTQIDFASDASLQWDESNGTFRLDHPIKTVVQKYTSDNATENAVFDALNQYIPTNGDEISLSGSLASDFGVNKMYIYIVNRAVRNSPTLIQIFGTLFRIEAGAMNVELTALHIVLNDGTGTAPLIYTTAITCEVCAISWG